MTQLDKQMISVEEAMLHRKARVIVLQISQHQNPIAVYHILSYWGSVSPSWHSTSNLFILHTETELALRMAWDDLQERMLR